MNLWTFPLCSYWVKLTICIETRLMFLPRIFFFPSVHKFHLNPSLSSYLSLEEYFSCTNDTAYWQRIKCISLVSWVIIWKCTFKKIPFSKPVLLFPYTFLFQNSNYQQEQWLKHHLWILVVINFQIIHNI